MENGKNRISYSFIFTLLVTIAGWGVTFGMCKTQVEQNTNNIERLEKKHNGDIMRVDTRQASTDALLQSINGQLVELNTKMSLLLNGNIKAAER